MCMLCYKWEPNTKQNTTNAITIVLVHNYRQGVRVTYNILPQAQKVCKSSSGLTLEKYYATK